MSSKTNRFLQRAANQPTVAEDPADPMRHYHVVTGEAIFRKGDGDELYTVRLNTLIQSLDGRIPLYLIGRAQQAIQVQLQKNMGDEGPILSFVDVVILNIIHLGVFNNKTFNALPEGSKLV